MSSARPIPVTRVPAVVRYAWVFPTTLFGLLFVPVALLSGGGVQVVDGALEVYGSVIRWMLRYCTLLKGGAAAMTIGHVVLGCDQDTLERTRSHERVHVRQAEHWGPLFAPAYILASFSALIRGRHPYRDNVFEREAFDCDR